MHARSCPEMEWSSSIVVGNSVDRSYKSNIVTLLCPLAVKQSDSQVCKSVCLCVFGFFSVQLIFIN